MTTSSNVPDKGLDEIFGDECTGFRCQHETGEKHYLLFEGDKADLLKWRTSAQRQVLSELKGKLPERPSNELITLSLQNGKPQQAASYNGFAAAIDQVTALFQHKFDEINGKGIER